jgi:peptidoglycan/LPS O-acetylase OafA/YrhL
LLFATALIFLFARDPGTAPDGSWLQNAQAHTVTPAGFFSEASLFRISYDINNVLWSLRWEVIFSLCLPAFVGLAVLLRKHAVILAVACGFLTVLGRVIEIDALVYLPVFMFGTLIAVHLERLTTWAARRARPRLWAATAALACLLMVGSWLARPVFEPGTLANSILWGLAGIGAALIIVIAIAWPALRERLERRPVQWLGKVSFSLYLVHAPILGTLGYLFGAEYWWAVGLVGIPLSVAIAAGFYRWVEAPTQRASRRVGIWVAERTTTRRRALAG